MKLLISMLDIKQIIWSKIWVYVIFALTTVIAISCLIYLEAKGPNVRVEDIVEYPLERKPLTFPIELKATTDLSPRQVTLLKEAVGAWERSSKGVVKVTVISGWFPPEPFNATFYEFYPEKTVWIKPSTNAEMTKLELRHGFFDGVAKGNMIAISDDGNLTDEKLKLIFAHEFGHMMGLEHIKLSYVSLMNVNAGDGAISNFDMLQFCTLYACKK